MDTKHGCLTTDEIKRQLDSVGINPTAQRIAICRFILCEADHPTADDVKSWADENFPMISRATVYNTLNTLTEAGLIKEVRFGHSNRVFYDTNTSHHYHFIDEESGKVYDVSPEEVDVQPRLDGKFKVSRIEVMLKGSR